MSVEYAHTPTAEQQRAAKAQTLARWCYARGLVDDAILQAAPKLRRAAARSAGVAPPTEHDGPGETWQLVVALLARKLTWDREHNVTSPQPARCTECAISGDWCNRHMPRNCTSCGGELHWVLLEEGSTTHPSCDLADADQAAVRPVETIHLPPPAPELAVVDATLY